MIELSARDARRLAVTAQLLTEPRPHDLDEVATGLAAVQMDMTDYVAPNAELVFFSRLGAGLGPDEVYEAVASGQLVEVRGFLRPAQDVALFAAEMAAWPGQDPPPFRAGRARWVEQNHFAREQVLDQLRSDGPLPARELVADFAQDWRSSGWNDVKNAQMLLECLAEAGEVAVSHRSGRQRVWDLAVRVYPETDPIPVEEALVERDRRRLRSLGIARAKGPACPVEPMGAGAAGVPARVTGVRGEWRVDPELLDMPFTGRTALLSPLDRLVFDRKRMTELLEFEYALEMYKPARQRRWGYFALPVLHLDRLVGKVDAHADLRSGRLLVRAVHEDDPWSAATRRAVQRELDALAAYLGLAVEMAR